MCDKNCSSICDPSEFFADVKSNLTKIVWAHAVNSEKELKNALSSENVMMLEADVVMGTINRNSTPIMAHPPSTKSDLSLEQFLNITSENGTKGIKLDFKTNEAFKNSIPILEKWRPTLKYPVFLNADILPGPVNATTTPVDAKEFLTGAIATLPEAVLSVGWTTRYGMLTNITEGRYSKEQLKQMVDTLKENKVTQPVTYPVRAGLVTKDIDAMNELLKNTTFAKATLTIWSSEGDSVNAQQLSELIEKVGIDKVYLDVPNNLKKELQKVSSGSTMTSAMSLGASLVLLALSQML
ncbi:hypothetical protein PUN28_018576 [Cardiocondyla obscurior]